MRLNICFVFGILLFAMFGWSSAALSRALPSLDPAHKGKCYDPSKKTLHTLGEEFTDHESCTRVTCLQDSSMEFATCGSIGTEPPCRIVKGDLSKDYPDCCPQIDCN